MKGLRILLFSVICLTTSLLARAEEKLAGAKSHITGQADAAAASRPSGPGLTEDDRQDLEKDLQKMHVLIDQMQRNLAATSTGETPLKQQFRLEIDMWQLLVSRMERQLGRKDE